MFSVVLLSSGVATAATVCGANNYKYSGQTSYKASNPTTWSDVEGDISVDSISVYGPLTADHFIAYLDLVDHADMCFHNSQQCFLQAGYGKGDVGNHESKQGQTLEPYAETSDEFGYSVNWVDGYGLTQDDYVMVINTGNTDTQGYYQWQAWIQPTTLGNQMIAEGWYPSLVGSAYAQAEGDNAASGYDCPSMTKYEYFGTNGAGGGGDLSQYQLRLYGLLSGWQPWDVADAIRNPDLPPEVPPAEPPYTYTPLYSASAFEGYGG
jgi:hypothetical protein